ncbi:hypothetical protein RIF29_20386 [Crotalaria pallida]|uniref:Ubiquitin-like domain-containing protein n=1 Tax=Crotalaria pallida TaxID=3830 RepID=A0AAN9F9K8_CROPI
MVLFTIIGGEIAPGIEMSSSETILDLKEKIQEVLDIEVHRQSLWYNNMELRDTEFIDACGFHRDATVILRVTSLPQHVKLHVLVKHIGSNGYVRVKETDMVHDLRRKVEKYWGIPLEFFTLYRLNIEMMDNHPLYAYYINEASEVKLCVSIEPR